MYLLVGVLNVKNKLMTLILQVMMIQKWKMKIILKDTRFVIHKK